MKVSAKADYAVRAAAELAAAGTGAPVRAEAIATAQGIPQRFLENILSDLRHAGLVQSVRGAEGGHRLNRPAAEITVADVIRAVDGPLAAVRGERPESVTYTGPAEPLQRVWIALRKNLREVVEHVTLADLASGQAAEGRRRARGRPGGLDDAAKPHRDGGLRYYSRSPINFVLFRRSHPVKITSALVATALAVVVAGCGGASDEVGGGDAPKAASGGSSTKLSLVAYAVPKVGFDKVIPLFEQTPAGKGVTFSQSYGASGDQSRKVESGLPTDIVNFSVEPDVTRLVKSGQVDDDWNSGEHKGIPFGSVVTIVTRQGNPKGIKTWDDLLKPGVEVVTPNPFSSGSAKWNLLAPYSEKSNGGQNPEAGLDYLSKLIGDHVKVQPKSGREATETFLQGTGDVLLSYENEALFAERNGDPVEHTTPDTTFKIENPVAVLNTSKNREKAQAFVDFLYTPEGQKAWAEAGFRPVDPAVVQEFAADFPAPKKLYTIDDLGGWSRVNEELFEPETGSVAKIYDAATS